MIKIIHVVNSNHNTIMYHKVPQSTTKFQLIYTILRIENMFKITHVVDSFGGSSLHRSGPNAGLPWIGTSITFQTPPAVTEHAQFATFTQTQQALGKYHSVGRTCEKSEIFKTLNQLFAVFIIFCIKVVFKNQQITGASTIWKPVKILLQKTVKKPRKL